jgi:hypothetical protein
MAVPRQIMLGEELNSSDATKRGLVGDRAYARIDKETGKVARWQGGKRQESQEMGKFFDCHSVFMETAQVANIPPYFYE